MTTILSLLMAVAMYAAVIIKDKGKGVFVAEVICMITLLGTILTLFNF